MSVDAGRIPVGFGEDGAIRDAAGSPLAGHEGHDRGLHAHTQADDRQTVPCASAPGSLTVGAPGSEVSPCRLLQDLGVQRQIRHPSPQLAMLRLHLP